MALSLGLPPPAVNRHRLSVEPGLSSISTCAMTAVTRPSDKMIIKDRVLDRQLSGGAKLARSNSLLLRPQHQKPQFRRQEPQLFGGNIERGAAAMVVVVEKPFAAIDQIKDRPHRLAALGRPVCMVR